MGRKAVIALIAVALITFTSVLTHGYLTNSSANARIQIYKLFDSNNDEMMPYRVEAKNARKVIWAGNKVIVLYAKGQERVPLKITERRDDTEYEIAVPYYDDIEAGDLIADREKKPIVLRP